MDVAAFQTTNLLSADNVIVVSAVIPLNATVFKYVDSSPVRVNELLFPLTPVSGVNAIEVGLTVAPLNVKEVEFSPFHAAA